MEQLQAMSLLVGIGYANNLNIAYCIKFKNSDKSAFAPYQGEFKLADFKGIMAKFRR